MEPRFIIRTHKEVSRPGIFTALIRECTNPSKSFQPYVISKRLHDYFKKTSYKLSNPGGATFAIEIAKKFGFLTDNLFWDWKGRVINSLRESNIPITPEEYLLLSEYEKILYLKYYLETQGALILEIAKLFVEYDSISLKELINNNYIEEIFVHIWNGYLPLTSLLSKKVELRESIKRMKRLKTYHPDTRRHKFLPILIPLIEFGFLEEREHQIFSPIKRNDYFPLKSLVNKLKNIRNLEAMFASYDYFDVITSCYHLNTEIDTIIDNKEVLAEINDSYVKIKQSVSNLASIDSIIDLVISKFLYKKEILLTRSYILTLIDSERERHPLKYRYHVSRSGEVSYLVINP